MVLTRGAEEIPDFRGSGEPAFGGCGGIGGVGVVREEGDVGGPWGVAGEDGELSLEKTFDVGEGLRGVD